LVGSVSVMAIKGFGVAVKLTFGGNNQFTHPSTYAFGIVVVGCIVVQMNFFNKALDTFSTNVYVRSHIFLNGMFTILQCKSHVLRRIFYGHDSGVPHPVPRVQYDGRHKYRYAPRWIHCHFPWRSPLESFTET
jgi:hypothetical protein